MKHYKVTAKCGHVGNGMFCVKNFYVKAKNKKEARSIVSKRPRVKKRDEELYFRYSSYQFR